MKTIALTYNLNRGNSDHEVEFDAQITIDELMRCISTNFHCIPIECDKNIAHWVSLLVKSSPDLIFNVAEGYSGAAREAFYPSLFEQLGIPYTGPGPTELLITHNKGLTKKLLANSDVYLPWSRVLGSLDDLTAIEPQHMPFPLILKLNSEGSSLGMDENCIVSNMQELEQQAKKLLGKFASNIIVEEYIEGRDISTTFVEGIGCLGPVEYVYPNESIYNFRLKGADNDTIDVVPPRDLPVAVSSLLLKHTKAISQLLDINGYCRVDFRLDGRHKPYFLEVNGQVSFHPIGAFVLAGRQQNFVFSDLVNHIIHHALQNKKRISRVGLIHDLYKKRVSTEEQLG